MRIHPTIVPYLTPMKQIKNHLGAYIAPVNHNKINSGIAVSITSTVMGRYSQDSDKDRWSGGKNVIFSNCPYDQSKYSDPLIYISI